MRRRRRHSDVAQPDDVGLGTLSPERRPVRSTPQTRRWSSTGTLDPSVPGRAPNWPVLVAPQVRGASPCAASSDPDDWYPAWGVARWKTVLRGHLNAVVR
jgi:hypothetical protein